MKLARVTPVPKVGCSEKVEDFLSSVCVASGG